MEALVDKEQTYFGTILSDYNYLSDYVCYLVECFLHWFM